MAGRAKARTPRIVLMILLVRAANHARRARQRVIAVHGAQFVKHAEELRAFVVAVYLRPPAKRRWQVVPDRAVIEQHCLSMGRVVAQKHSAIPHLKRASVDLKSTSAHLGFVVVLSLIHI